ncbi:transglycosylase SLT domain-containing protein [Sinorhizobium meliloti]|uniref:transglycosylase SLT domain-containing protein n=1 Tax=Rhizobium meliloti TaxID=382 RepID=UPI0004087D5F|nr:transglycosylase SLT domain-containing protein [Sinorhizobium meliloti]
MFKRLAKYLKTLVLTTAFLLSACGTVHTAEAPTHCSLVSFARGFDTTAATAEANFNTRLIAVGDERREMKAIIVEAAVQHGINPTDFLRVAEIESGFNPKAMHPKSRACGLFQFIPSTARSYGLTDCFNPRGNAEAAAALWLDNAARLRKALGREPSAGEQYLAHQQGLGGAIRLLANPEKLAREIVGPRAVTLNGGKLNMTAREFAQLWIKKMLCRPPPATGSKDDTGDCSD